ncbi:putative ribonuclease H-like domain-containing protein [Tanacetum coccineum]
MKAITLFQDFRYSDIECLSRSDEVLKLKNFKKDATFKLFKSTNQERYEHVGPKVTIVQDGIVYKMEKRDYAWLMISKVFKITFSHTSQDKGTSSCLKSKDTTTYLQDVVKERYEVYELKTKDKAYVDLKNVVPQGGLTCLFAKATLDESNLWHKRLGHVNFKTINKLVKGNLVRGSGPNWLFDIDTLTKSMNYKPVATGNQSNGSACAKACDNVVQRILLMLDSNHQERRKRRMLKIQKKIVRFQALEEMQLMENIVYGCADDLNMPNLEDIVYSDDDEEVGAEADINNLDAFIPVSSIPTTRIHKGHPVEQIIRDLNLAPQTRRMTKNLNEHGIDYDEVFAPVAIIEEIRLFLAYVSFKDFVVYRLDVKSAFLYGKIKEEVYVCQPPGYEDPDFPDKVYKVEKALYGLCQAPRAWYETLSTYLLDNGFQRGTTNKTLFIRRDKGDILLVQVCVDDIIFGSTVDDIIFGSTKKSLCTEFEKMMHKKFQMNSIASTPTKTHKPLLKDADGEDVDEHLYRSMIKSLMYLSSSRPDIMFAVCQPKLGLWYPKDSPFDLVAYTDSDYAGASLDRKSTTGAEYIAASNCYGQSTICIVKNPVFHSKIKHIDIRHHFIRDSNEKKLIQMIKIHTDQNVADLLTKAFDVSRFQYLIAKLILLVILTTAGITNIVRIERVGGVFQLLQDETLCKGMQRPPRNKLIAEHESRRLYERTVTVEETFQSPLEMLKQEKESNQLKIEKFDNASKSLDKLIGSQIPDKSRKGLGFVSYNVVPPPLQTSKNVSEDTSNEVRESVDAPMVEKLVLDDKLEKKTVFPTVAKIEFVRPKQQEKPVRKPVKPKAVNTARPNSAVVNVVRANQVNAVKASACWVWRPTKLNSASITLKKHNYGLPKRRSRLCLIGMLKDMTGNMSHLSDFKEFDGGYVTFRGGAKGGKITGKGTLKTGRRHKTLMMAARRTMLADLSYYYILADAINTAGYVQNRFDGKSDEGFFVGYSLNSKAFRVYNIRTRKVEESLHIRFLEDKPIIAGDGPKWLFDIDVQKKVLVQVILAEDRSSQDYILMPLWKDGSLFDSSLKNASNDEPQPSSNAGKKDDEGSGVQTRRMTKISNEQGFINAIYEGKPYKDLYTCLFACFLSQKVWTLVDLPYGKRAIGTKWVYRNKKDERGIMIRNKARLVAQGYTQEEGIYYDEVFAPVARTEAIRLSKPLGFEDLEFPDRVYKVEKALYGLHQAPRAWYETLSTYLLDNGFQRGQIDKTLFIKRVKGDILPVQVYVDDIIFGSTRNEMCTEFEKMMHKKFPMISMERLPFFFNALQTASTPMETSKPLLKDAGAEDVDVHLYRSMIGSLMYLTALRLDIMFIVYACARFQVTPKVSHLHAMKRIFRYLKGQPKLGLWYPKDSPFDLEAYTDSDYASASLDKKSTTGGCQFLRSRLISWQCKKQTIVANSTIEAKYVAAASCCVQVLWIQNQMLDYGYNFMNTKIFIDNESTIYIIKNPVFHSKTSTLRLVITSSEIQMRRSLFR